MTAELDLFPVNELGDRYTLARSNIYARLQRLGIKPEKQHGKAYLNAEQLKRMDDLHQQISSGGVSDDLFLSGQSGQWQESSRPGQSYLSRTTDWTELMSQAEATAFRLVLAIADKLPQPDPLSNLQQLERAYQNGWLLSTSQLAPLLGVKGLSGKVTDRFGFRCVRVGRNGAESAWKLEKLAQKNAPLGHGA